MYFMDDEDFKELNRVTELYPFDSGMCDECKFKIDDYDGIQTYCTRKEMDCVDA